MNRLQELGAGLVSIKEQAIPTAPPNHPQKHNPEAGGFGFAPTWEALTKKIPYSFDHPVHQGVGILRKVEIFCGDEGHDFLGFVFSAHILLGVQFRTFFHLPQLEHLIADLFDPQIYDFTPIHRKQPV